MKPLHVGLLVTGAALAGGLAVKMTQPPPLPVAAAATARATQPDLKSTAAASATPGAAPAPAPVTDRNPTGSGGSEPDTGPTAAPPPVYQEPQHADRSSGHRRPFPDKPAAETPKKVEVAKAERPEITEHVDTPRAEPYRPEPYRPAPESAAAPQPAPDQPVTPPQPSNARDDQPPPRQVTLRAGSTISVRLNQTLSTDRVNAGDSFQATLADPIVADGLVIAERGARVSGRVIDAHRAGRISGTSMLELGLVNVQTADGQRVKISTEPWSRQADGSNSAEAAKIGGGAVLGAIIGAIAGGGKGAAIGAGVGGGAGVGAAAVTGARPVNIPTETQIRFRLASNVTVVERQNY